MPDIRGTWGTFFYFGSELTQWDVGDTEFGGKLVRLELQGTQAASSIEGPADPTSSTFKRISVPINFNVTPDSNAVSIQVNEQTESVAEKQWSHWLRVKFSITPFLSVSAICRFYVIQVVAGFAALHVAAQFGSGVARPAGLISFEHDRGHGQEVWPL